MLRLLLFGLVLVHCNCQKEFYLITLPNALLVESENKLFIHTTIDIALQIETIHDESKLSESSQIFVLSEGHHNISYTVPFVGKLAGNSLKLLFKADRCLNKECSKGRNIAGNFINETYEINTLTGNYIIFSESDKPIYKPGELVKFRFFPFYPTNIKEKPDAVGRQWELKKKSNSYEKVLKMNSTRGNVFETIILENPEGVRFAQWKNISVQQAMELSFQLSADPVFGKWKIDALFMGKNEKLNFIVKRYVLPRFVVDVVPPDEILFSDKSVSFAVCSKYSTDKLMKANIVGKFCLHRGRNVHKCVPFQGKLDGSSKCAYFIVLLKKLEIKDQRLVYYNTKTSINVTVTENGTTLAVSKTTDGRGILTTRYNIKLMSNNYFKPTFPYLGKIKLTKINGGIVANATITVSIREFSYLKSFGFVKNFTSDKNGIVSFLIPFMPDINSLGIRVTGTEKIRGVMQNPNMYNSLTKWESIAGKYVQLSVNRSELKCPGNVRLNVLMNENISSVDLFVQVFARGRIVAMHKFAAVPHQCRARSDYMGHFTCLDNSRIKCLPGWRGPNCLEPVCQGCVNGACVTPGECVCKSGWGGTACSECILMRSCVHGECRRGNDCYCLPGWSGYSCNRKAPTMHQYVSRPSSVTTTRAPGSTVGPDWQLRQSMFERELQLPLPADSGPDVHLLVYWIATAANSSELIADALELSDNENPVPGLKTDCTHAALGSSASSGLKFSQTQTRPGQKVSLRLQLGLPQQQRVSCALRVADVALQQFGEASSANLDTLAARLLQMSHRVSTRIPYSRRSCITPWQMDLSRRRRSVMMQYNGYDSNRAMLNAGITPISNLRIINAFCPVLKMYNSVPMAMEGVQFLRKENVINTVEDDVQSNERKLEKQVKKIKQKVRDFFPESWIFEYHHNTTQSQFDYTVPDSITTWKADAFCMTSKGLWISPSDRLKVTLPFYADIYVPYSIKLNETLQMPVKLFNYVAACYEIKADLIFNNSEIQVVGPRSFTTCVCKDDVKSLFFSLRPRVLGSLNVTIAAESQRSSFCGNSGSSNSGGSDNTEEDSLVAAVDMRDSIRRQLLVKPGGVETEKSYSELLCGQAGVKSEFLLPGDIVPGSLRSYLIYTANVMGQTMDNLDSLVRMPYGCGEQNMVALVPSVYVLQYLTATVTKDAKDAQDGVAELQAKARKYIVSGFQRQQKYRHKDGSYSAFGERGSSANGSTWLTAFVVRSFAEAEHFVDLDGGAVVRAGAIYLSKMQRSSTGCFQERGKLFSSAMAGGVGSSSAATDESLLTAYVLVALKSIRSSNKLLLGVDIDAALNCLRLSVAGSDSRNKENRNYRLALSGLAFALYEPKSPTTASVMEQLQSRVTRVSNRHQFWSAAEGDKTGSRSARVETTGYALLALSAAGAASDTVKFDVVKAVPVVQWLSSQRNSLGGYYSTQDTVVALQALSSFAASTGAGAAMTSALSLSVSINHEMKPLVTGSVLPGEQLLTKRVPLGDRNISYVSLNTPKTTDTGCLMVQLISLFNQNRYVSARDTFRLTVKDVTNYGRPISCESTTLSVCSSYLRRDVSSGMLLVTLDLPSGYSVTGDHQTRLLEDSVLGPLMKVELQKTRINFYYDGFSYRDVDSEPRCVEVTLTRQARLLNLQPSLARIVDYYNPEVYMDVRYSISCNDTEKSPYKPQQPVCPSCSAAFNASTIVALCSDFTGIIATSGSNSSSSLVTFFQPYSSVFYEWSVSPRPLSCGCLSALTTANTSSRLQLALSSRPIGLDNEQLRFYQTAQVLPLSSLYSMMQTDVHQHCRSASNLFKLLSRIDPQLHNNVPAPFNYSCPKYVFLQNRYFLITNMTELLCAVNRTVYSTELDQTAITTSTSLNMIMKLSSENETVNANLAFPSPKCFASLKMSRTVKFSIVINNEDNADFLESIKTENTVIMDDKIMIVENSVFESVKYYRCP